MSYLLLAIASSTLVSVCMRWSTGKVRGKTGMLAVNYLCCTLLAAWVAGGSNLFPAHAALPGTIAMGTVSGILYLAGFLLLQKSMSRNGVVFSSIFMKLGLLVPMILSIVAFHQVPSVIQGIGFVIALGAVVLINLEKSDTAPAAKGLLLLLLLAGGGADAMSKVYEELGAPALSGQFLFFTFFTAFLLCLAITAWKKQWPGLRELFFGLLIGIPNFFSARFLLYALGKMSAVVVYPTFSAGTLLVVTLSGVLLFWERLNRRQILALGAILVALVLLNL